MSKHLKEQHSGETSKGSYFDNYTKQASSKVDYFDSQTFNIWNYLRVEMFGIGQPGTLEPPNQAHIDNFFTVPFHLESLIFLGFFICLDAFLYVITYLPIRVVFSVYLLLVSCYNHIHAEYLSLVLPFLFPPKKLVADQQQHGYMRFHRTQTYDIMRGAMFAVGCVALRHINMSQVYHFIRGQSMIKLYVLTSMLEIFDKLLSSFGQDAFDALHWHTRFNPRSFKLFVTFIMVTVYVCLHAGVYFLHVATLTVVINSVDSALLTVLILNNFSELKTFILKKFDCNNLFQLACSDITERFQSFLFLSLIMFVAIAQAGGLSWEMVVSYGRIAGMMLAGECFADWFKHAFINKFNLINASVYMDFAYVLRNDILSNQKDEVILDHTYSVTRRLGMSQIPLGCVCVRYITLALATPMVQLYIQQSTATWLALLGFGSFACLLLAKVAIGVGLVFYSAGAHKRDAAVFLRSPAAVTAAPPTLKTDKHDKYDKDKSTENSSATIRHNATHPSSHSNSNSINNSIHSGGGWHPAAQQHSAATAAGIALEEEQFPLLPAVVANTTGRIHNGNHSNNSNRACTTANVNPVSGTSSARGRSRNNSVTEQDAPLHISTATSTTTAAEGDTLGSGGNSSGVDGEVGGSGAAGSLSSPSRSYAPAPATATAAVAVGLHAKVSRPPLGRLNMSNLSTSTFSPQNSVTEQGKAFFDSNNQERNAASVTPPLSPLSRPGSDHIPVDYHHQLLSSPAAAGTTSTPIVQLDANAYNAYTSKLLAESTFTGADLQDMSDNEDAHSVQSEVSRHTTVDEATMKMHERLQFMEELSSMERYTVYKGRII